ncbi:uncharacterized protein LOC119448956 [Dermacentor silvarum]|uniref:uncharacterized protein LOC119448956 n=1 Tax=Dermacentor silvarum TaxID=543639 RepID=UPI0021012950|nr:uncharacterized protein LOC119448956 [Dermacentor silvarum]
MSNSKIHVDISSQTRVNVSRSSGSQPDMRPVTPPMMYQPMAGPVPQPQMMFAPPPSPPPMMAPMMPQQFMQQPPPMAFAPQPQMAFVPPPPPPMMYGPAGPMYASTRSPATTCYAPSYSGGYPDRRDSRDWDSDRMDQESDYRPPRRKSSRGKGRSVWLVLLRTVYGTLKSQ